ncbi:site-specific integrase [Colwellia sp. MB3u-55]|uniref:tyrosine-type recombinase/integrase n=1 Tax=Colwellia sp. MB3u-55 TaxID=2759810 RepID=UPI0015F4AF5D|nr:site-specific integrase [Colwellia sp. MB3u-55]MBA6250980.1 tyrosine-type recombinase/integrase [Colwellia sp. MB3u-55]
MPKLKSEELYDTTLKSYQKGGHAKRFDKCDGKGLWIRVYESGAISFYFRFKSNLEKHTKGKQEGQLKIKRLIMGQYPALSLKDARKQILPFKEMLQNGLDPDIELKKDNNKSKLTFDDCIELFMRKHVSELRDSSEKNYKSTLVKYCVGVFSQPVEEITKQEWYALLDKVKSEQSPITANTLVKKIKTCLRCIVEWGDIPYIEKIDAFSVFSITTKKVGKESKPVDRYPELHELKIILNGIDKSGCYPSTRNTIKVAMLTAARCQEVRHMEVNDLDLENNIWYISESKSKTGEAFKRPLVGKVLEIIKWQIETFGHLTSFVFPSGSYKQAISSQTVNKLCRGIRDKENMRVWTLHDFRRSLSTILSSKGTQLHVTESMLGHKLGGILSIYNKYDWLEDQKIAYEKWENMILSRDDLQLKEI